MEAGGRLVEDVEGTSGGSLAELGSQLDPLRLSTGEGGRRLSEPDVTQADIEQRLEHADDFGLVGENRQGFLNGHVEHFGDGMALPEDLERLPVVAGARGTPRTGRRRREGSAFRS